MNSVFKRRKVLLDSGSNGIVYVYNDHNVRNLKHGTRIYLKATLNHIPMINLSKYDSLDYSYGGIALLYKGKPIGTTRYVSSDVINMVKAGIDVYYGAIIDRSTTESMLIRLMAPSFDEMKKISYMAINEIPGYSQGIDFRDVLYRNGDTSRLNVGRKSIRTNFGGKSFTSNDGIVYVAESVGSRKPEVVIACGDIWFAIGARFSGYEWIKSKAGDHLKQVDACLEMGDHGEYWRFDIARN